jgi:NAD(P)-dependent dehydrogenase (short-subunit alcohol dehydrogenase family)
MDGKAVVVTGSGRGLGAQYAQLAAKEGAKVVVNDIDPSAVDESVEKIRSDGGQATGSVADITDWAESERLIDTCVKEYGKIDGLVNNAGVQMIAGPLELDEPLLRKMIEVNVVGTIFCGVHAMRRMVEQGSGSIVNVSSGAHLGLKMVGPYGATKGAVASLAYCWAADLEGTGVRVNAISPLGATRMAEEFVEIMETPESERENVLGTFPEPASNAPLIVYLLSDLASDVSGQLLRTLSGKISVVSRPAVILPPIENPAGTVEGVAELVAKSLKAQFTPTGPVLLGGAVSDALASPEVK